MIKKPLFWIALVVFAALLAGLGVFGKQYYENRYVGSGYYAMVPADYDMTSKPVNNMSGQPVGTGILYKLTAYDAAGEAKAVSFTVVDPTSDISLGEKQPQPGDYLKINAGKTAVINWNLIDKSAVPAAALAKIQGS